MLSAAPAEKDADPKFFHDLPVWTQRQFRVNRRDGTDLWESWFWRFQRMQPVTSAAVRQTFRVPSVLPTIVRESFRRRQPPPFPGSGHSRCAALRQRIPDIGGNVGFRITAGAVGSLRHLNCASGQPSRAARSSSTAPLLSSFGMSLPAKRRWPVRTPRYRGCGREKLWGRNACAQTSGQRVEPLSPAHCG